MKTRDRTCQRGSALVVALLILVTVTVLALSSMSSSLMELRMVHGTQATIDNFQTAAGAIDLVLANPDNLPMTGALDNPQPRDLTPVFPPPPEVLATVARTQECLPPPRARLPSSVDQYSAFVHEVVARVDRNQNSQGRLGMTQGHILIGPRCQ